MEPVTFNYSKSQLTVILRFTAIERGIRMHWGGWVYEQDILNHPYAVYDGFTYDRLVQLVERFNRFERRHSEDGRWFVRATCGRGLTRSAHKDMPRWTIPDPDPALEEIATTTSEKSPDEAAAVPEDANAQADPQENMVLQ